ncbi:MAG: ATP-binding protein [Acidobacteriota bacterium]
MQPLSFYLESIIVCVIASILVLMWRRSQRDVLSPDRGWWLIFGGFTLFFLGALIDLSDHFPQLSKFVILGRTPTQSFFEKAVGFTGGFLLVALGFSRWLPQIAARKRLEAELRDANEQLAQKVREGSQEIRLSRLRSEIAMRRHRQTERLLENMVSGAAVALFATDLEGRVTHAAGHALESLELDAGAIGRPLSRLMPPAASPLESTLEGGEVTAAQAAHGDLMLQLRLAPLADPEGRREGAVVVATDITELYRTQVELESARDEAEAASRSKSSFLATMSHELRTPLNSIIGFANLLEKNRRGSLGEEELNFLVRIRDNGLHLLALINDILDLSKIEAGHLELALEPAEIGQMVREVSEELRPQLRSAVRLKIEVPPGLPRLETDVGRLRQVLRNLLSNAIKFTHEGTITVRLIGDPAATRALEVEDSGIGIPEDRLNTIFEAFQQVDASTARHYGGTGLGLSICRSLCQMMGYSITVCSQPNAGSTFTVVFGSAPD